MTTLIAMTTLTTMTKEEIEGCEVGGCPISYSLQLGRYRAARVLGLKIALYEKYQSDTYERALLDNLAFFELFKCSITISLTFQVGRHTDRSPR